MRRCASPVSNNARIGTSSAPSHARAIHATLPGAAISATQPRSQTRIRRLAWLLAFVAVDQWLKWLVRTRMIPGDSLPLIPHVLHLTLVQNTGAAFGLLRGAGPLLILISVAVVAVLAWSLRQTAGGGALVQRLHRLSLWLVLSGAVGNLIDRLRFGYVIDFIDLRVWPVFNLADSAITVGMGLLIWTMLRGTRI